MALQFANTKNSNDRDVVELAVRQDGSALKYAGDIMRDDPHVVKAAVEQFGPAIALASPAMQRHRSIGMLAVQQDGWAYNCLHESLQGDVGVAQAAVGTSPQVLRMLPAVMRAEREVVLAAVRRDGRLLQHASPELRGEREVVLAALASDQGGGAAFAFALGPATGERDVALAAVAADGRLLAVLSAELRSDREVVATAVTQSTEALRHVAAGLHGQIPATIQVHVGPSPENEASKAVRLPGPGWSVAPDAVGSEGGGYIVQTAGPLLTVTRADGGGWAEDLVLVATDLLAAELQAVASQKHHELHGPARQRWGELCLASWAA
eukprot:SAG22_NODE_5693_length_970_cov_2.117107_1_plen_322_part_11